MATSEIYCGFEITWRETGERFIATVRLPGEQRPPAVISATVEEGMTVLKARTRQIIADGRAEDFRPLLCPYCRQDYVRRAALISAPEVTFRVCPECDSVWPGNECISEESGTNLDRYMSAQGSTADWGNLRIIP